MSLVVIILLIILGILCLFSLAVGSAGYTIIEILKNVFSEGENPVKTIVINLRLPRIILALLIGAGLSSSGVLLQSVMRNPLADPGTIGISAGAATIASSILLIFPTMTKYLPIFAFLGAILACVLIYVLAWKEGIDPVRIILSGVAINAVLGAYTSLLQLMNSDNLQGVLSFLNGSLYGKSWSEVKSLSIYLGIGLFLSILCIKNANVLQLGDEVAKSLGTKVNLSRIILSAVSAFLAASTVAFVGMIGFVGLVVPHIARILVASNYKFMLIISMLLGADILLFADTIGRVIVPGMEIPVGIVMAMSGGPFFLYMLRKKRCS